MKPVLSLILALSSCGAAFEALAESAATSESARSAAVDSGKAAEKTNTDPIGRPPRKKHHKKSKKDISPEAAATPAPSTSTPSSENSGGTSSSGAGSLGAGTSSLGGTSIAVEALPERRSRKSPIIAQFNNYVFGSPIADPISNAQPDYRYGGRTEGIRVETHLVLGYRLTDNLSLSLNPQFESNNAARDTDHPNKDTTLLHPFLSYVKLGVGRYFQVGHFRWNGEWRYYPPVTSDLRRAPNVDGRGDHQELVHYLRVHNNFVYDLTSRITVGAFTIVRYFERQRQYQNGNVALLPEAFLQVGYQARDNVNLSIGYDMSAAQNYGGPVTKFYVPPSQNRWVYTYLEPAVEWNATKFLTVYPYVDISTGEKINFHTSRLGLNLLMPIL